MTMPADLRRDVPDEASGASDAAHTVRRRWLAVTAASVLVPLALVGALGHRGVHAARSLLVPGAGLYDHAHLALGLTCTAAFVAATVAWVRWGLDWLVVAIVVATVAASAVLATGGTSPSGVVRGAHEFPLVVIVVSAIAWVQRGVARLVPHRRDGADRAGALDELSPVERCQAAAIDRLAGSSIASLASAIDLPDVATRARRVGLAARGRTGGDPFRIDNAHARAARSLCDVMDGDERARFVLDARRARDGVPCSEPGWTRLLDGTLAAVALRDAGDDDAGRRWSAALDRRWALQRGHRPAATWTPLGLRVGHAAPWEHATATAIARAAGWVGDDDWTSLRRRMLAAAARTSRRPHDERLVAAGRLWLAFLDDDVAARVLARATIGSDPLAAALDRLATRHADAHLLAPGVLQEVP